MDKKFFKLGFLSDSQLEIYILQKLHIISRIETTPILYLEGFSISNLYELKLLLIPRS